MSMRRSVLRSLQVGATSLILVGVLVPPVLAAPPGNDDRGAATVIGAVPYQQSLDTSEATAQVNDPDCSSGANNPTVWFSFTPVETGRYGASTFGSDYDTTLLVATPDNGGLDVIECNDDAAGVSSTVVWQAQAGQTYLIMAGACCGQPGGQLEFRLRMNPPMPRVQITLAATGSVNRYGAAVLRGRVTCRRAGGGTPFIEVTAKQTAGRFFIRGGGGAEARCGSTWRARARSDFGMYKPGKVAVRANTFLCSAWGCSSDQARQTVRLRR